MAFLKRPHFSGLAELPTTVPPAMRSDAQDPVEDLIRPVAGLDRASATNGHVRVAGVRTGSR
jgi:hypothetical protein